MNNNNINEHVECHSRHCEVSTSSRTRSGLVQSAKDVDASVVWTSSNGEKNAVTVLFCSISM